jgi:hypothetical protein
VYSTDLTIPLGAFAAGLGDHRIVTTLCPGGKERMRRLMSVIEGGRVDLQRPEAVALTGQRRTQGLEVLAAVRGQQADDVLDHDGARRAALALSRSFALP